MLQSHQWFYTVHKTNTQCLSFTIKSLQRLLILSPPYSLSSTLAPTTSVRLAISWFSNLPTAPQSNHVSPSKLPSRPSSSAHSSDPPSSTSISDLSYHPILTVPELCAGRVWTSYALLHPSSTWQSADHTQLKKGENQNNKTTDVLLSMCQALSFHSFLPTTL